VLTASPNAGGSNAANLSSATPHELEFNISEAGNYVISFTDQTSVGGYHEFLLLDCRIILVESTGISTVDDSMETVEGGVIYDAAGRKTMRLSRGLNIVSQPDGTRRKIIIAE
jgi:hypothetical protein